MSNTTSQFSAAGVQVKVETSPVVRVELQEVAGVQFNTGYFPKA